MYQQLLEKEKKIAVIGLGYVGLPIALAFAKKLSVIGFDINPHRVALMQQGIDPSNELPATAFADSDILFTHNLEDLRRASFYIVAVPTPVDDYNVPDLAPILKASKTIGQVIRQGDTVVFESTVYPGCTEDDCLPVIEKISGLKAGVDFTYGYSPERINPGDSVHTLQNVVKVVSGSDADTLELVARVYELVVTAGVHRASSVKVEIGRAHV
jgi:UDP-N-acetyl-D-galactosamine dehydrogenase